MDEAGDTAAGETPSREHGAEGREPAHEPNTVDAATVDREIRIRLASAALLLAAVMVLPILTSFTTVLNGFVGGVGAGWVAGFAEFVIALGGAIAYCAWADRRHGDRELPEPPARTAAARPEATR